MCLLFNQGQNCLSAKRLNSLDCCKFPGRASILRESEMTPVTGIHAGYFVHSARILLASGQTNKFDMNSSFPLETVFYWNGGGGANRNLGNTQIYKFFLSGRLP